MPAADVHTNTLIQSLIAALQLITGVEGGGGAGEGRTYAQQPAGDAYDELRRVCGFSEMSHLNHSCPHHLSRTPKLRTDFMREEVVVGGGGGGVERICAKVRTCMSPFGCK